MDLEDVLYSLAQADDLLGELESEIVHAEMLATEPHRSSMLLEEVRRGLRVAMKRLEEKR